MDLEQEFALANLRIRQSLERNYRIAMARLEGMTPEDYTAKLDKERAEAAQAEFRRGAEAAQAEFRRGAEALGASLRAIRDSLVEAAEGLARGWNAAGRVP